MTSQPLSAAKPLCPWVMIDLIMTDQLFWSRPQQTQSTFKFNGFMSVYYLWQAFCFPFVVIYVHTAPPLPFEEQNTADSAKASHITWQITATVYDFLCIVQSILFMQSLKKCFWVDRERKKIKCMHTKYHSFQYVFLQPIHTVKWKTWRCVICSMLPSCGQKVTFQHTLKRTWAAWLQSPHMTVFQTLLMLAVTANVCLVEFYLVPLSFPISFCDLDAPGTSVINVWKLLL